MKVRWRQSEEISHGKEIWYTWKLMLRFNISLFYLIYTNIFRLRPSRKSQNEDKSNVPGDNYSDRTYISAATVLLMPGQDNMINSGSPALAQLGARWLLPRGCRVLGLEELAVLPRPEQNVIMV